MKKTVFIFISGLLAIGAQAQSSNVETAAIHFRNLEMEDAKKAIDEAAAHNDTKNDPKTWYYYAAIYDTLYRNPQYKSIDKDLVEKFAVGCKKCVDLDVKKKYEFYCREMAIINSAFGCYNKALEHYNNKEYSSALHFFGLVMQVFPYDKERVLAKNNITEKSIILTMADMALKSENFPEAKKQLQKLIDMDYNDHVIYILMSNIFLTQDKDTVKALEYIDMGRRKFQSEKDLINQELNIYMAQGRQDVLLKKLNEALEADGENQMLLYVRGNVYDQFSGNSYKNYKTAKDTSEILSKKAKNEKIPANKSKMDAATKKYRLMSDSLYKQSKMYVQMAESDYKKILEVNPDYLDAYFNLGALTNNKTTEIVEQMNALNYNAPDYDKKFKALKTVQDSILNVSLKYFDKALQLADNLPEDDDAKLKDKIDFQRSILSSMQSVYANLGDEKKTIEMKKRKESLGR